VDPDPHPAEQPEPDTEPGPDGQRLPENPDRPRDPETATIVLTYWRPWLHANNALGYVAPRFRIAGRTFIERVPTPRFVRSEVQTRTVRVPVRPGEVEVTAVHQPVPFGSRREPEEIIDTVRLRCHAGDILHLEFIPSNLCYNFEGAFKLPGSGPGNPWANGGILVSLIAVPVAIGYSGWLTSEVLADSPVGTARNLGHHPWLVAFTALIVAIAAAHLIGGIWAALRPRGPRIPMRTPKSTARAAQTADAIRAAGGSLTGR
jgi:hypothetical protein